MGNEQLHNWRIENKMFQRLQIFLVLLGAAAGAGVSASGCNKFYRIDYTYMDQFDAFYKLHWNQAGRTWDSAFLACDDEGSTLFYPKTKEECTVVQTLIAAMKHKPNDTEIFIGIHDEFGLGEFMTVDGLSTPSPLPDREDSNSQNACVTMDIDTGVYKLQPCETDTVKPFVCKKVEKIVPFCPTIDSEYTYYKEIKKCYKVSQRKKSWTDAMQTCFMEGGILAIINNYNEANIIIDILRQKQLYNVQLYVGFRRLLSNGDFYTVKGQQFDNSFYTNWRSRDYDNNEGDCGVVERSDNGDGLITGTKACLQTAFFICEMIPKA